MDFLRSLVISFVALVGGVLGFVQQHPEFPQDQKDQAQQAITQATQKLNTMPQNKDASNQSVSTHTSASFDAISDNSGSVLKATPTPPNYYKKLPTTMSFVLESKAPDSAAFTVSFGDDTSGILSYRGHSTGDDKDASTYDWVAPDHTYSVPKNYTATAYRNGKELTQTTFCVGSRGADCPLYSR